MKKILLKISRISKNILFVVILSYASISIVSYHVAVNIFPVQWFSIGSSSMEPIINKGDIVFVADTDILKLKQGDIITFYVDIYNKGNKQIVTHFLDHFEYEDNTYKFYTRPNVTNSIDRWVIEEESIIGKVVFRIPILGLVHEFLFSLWGIIFVVFHLSIILINKHIYKKESL